MTAADCTQPRGEATLSAAVLGSVATARLSLRMGTAPLVAQLAVAPLDDPSPQQRLQQWLQKDGSSSPSFLVGILCP